jgi:DNA-binding NarL/FixJ family response regulator
MTTAPTIGIVVDDMFFAAKIRAAADAAGRAVQSIKTLEQLHALNDAKPELVILDLNSNRVDAVEAIQFLKSKPELALIPLVGFVSHVDTEAIRRAQDAGCDYVLPRSAFNQMLTEIVAGQFGRLRAQQT